MKLYDISTPIRPGMQLYAGDPPTLMAPWTSLSTGDPASVSRISIGTHTGTHVDAPAHFLLGGATVDRIDLGACIGPVDVVDLLALSAARVDTDILRERMPDGAERLLLKTHDGSLWDAPAMQNDFAALTDGAAAWLVGRGVRLVGIDYLSVAPVSDPAPVHRTLLAAGVVILEGLDLRAVAAGRYTLVCLPLRLHDADGAPARAVLLRDE
jgi:arylformamidase